MYFVWLDWTSNTQLAIYCILLCCYQMKLWRVCMLIIVLFLDHLFVNERLLRVPSGTSEAIFKPWIVVVVLGNCIAPAWLVCVWYTCLKCVRTKWWNGGFSPYLLCTYIVLGTPFKLEIILLSHGIYLGIHLQVAFMHINEVVGKSVIITTARWSSSTGIEIQLNLL